MNSTSYLLKNLLHDCQFILKTQHNLFKKQTTLLRKLQNQSKIKGSNCSKEGSKYEIKVWEITNNVKIEGQNTKFNTQPK